MKLERRAVVGAVGAGVASVAGCLRASTAVEPSDEEPRMELRNELDDAVTVEVSVVPADASDPVVDERYDLDAGETRTVSVAGSGPFEVAASMVDGPVESIFEQEWDAETDPTLAVSFRDSGVQYD